MLTLHIDRTNAATFLSGLGYDQDKLDANFSRINPDDFDAVSLDVRCLRLVMVKVDIVFALASIKAACELYDLKLYHNYV